MEAELADATAGQEQRFAEAFRLIEDGIAQRTFPGAALAVTWRGELVAWRGFGRFTYGANSPEVTRETVWDLASLTKAIATTSMAMLLWQRGKLKLDARLTEWVPEFATATNAEDKLRGMREEVTVAMLLAHSSGLPAHRKLYLENNGREAMLRAALQVPLEQEPMWQAVYSDIGFILLGEFLERIAGERVDEFCGREVFEPLKLKLMFSPYPSRLSGFPPTVDDKTYRHRVVEGEVNDENAWAMGGVAGHAGLFGDARSVARFAECMLRGGEGLFGRETVERFTVREAAPEGTSRTLGWDTPTKPSQSGAKFSARSFGHLGYTGTSLWCDPERQLSVTLLTNRTWPDARNQAIKQVRPAVHDAVVSALG